MLVVVLVHRYRHQAFTVIGRVPNMKLTKHFCNRSFFTRPLVTQLFVSIKLHDRSSCDIQIIEVDIDIVIKNPVFDYDCCLQRWKYRFEMSLFNFTTGLLTGNIARHFQKVSSTKISRALRRNLPGTDLQGSSGARPSNHSPKGCVLVRNHQEGQWERGLGILIIL